MLKSCACFRCVRYLVLKALAEIFQVNFSWEIDEIDL